MGELLKTLKEQNSSELITKWENIGFLSNTKNKRNLALACEFSALYLLDNIEKYNGEITTLTHPVIVRIFRNIEEDLPTKLIFDKVIQIITEFSDKLNEIQKTDEWINRGENKVKDVEAEFIAKFSDNFPFEFGKVCGLKKIDFNFKTFEGKKHKEESKKLIGEKNSINQKGENNSQFGTCWITNGKENKKIKKEEIIPNGWKLGRK